MYRNAMTSTIVPSISFIHLSETYLCKRAPIYMPRSPPIPVKGAVAPPDWLLGILFGAGGLTGMYLGARLQKYVSEKWIKLMLGTIVLVIALRYIL